MKKGVDLKTTQRGETQAVELRRGYKSAVFSPSSSEARFWFVFWESGFFMSLREKSVVLRDFVMQAIWGLIKCCKRIQATYNLKLEWSTTCFSSGGHLASGISREKRIMELKEVEREQLKEIMSEMSCKKNFECYKCGFENLCNGEPVGGHFVKCERANSKCSEEKRLNCDFSISFGYGFVCRCPIRIYVAKIVK